MMKRVEEISEDQLARLSYFAEQTWNQFLAYVYGTSTYAEMIKQEDDSIDVWASALHAVLQELIFGKADRADLMEKYGITSQMLLQWKQAHAILYKFTKAVFPVLK